MYDPIENVLKKYTGIRCEKIVSGKKVVFKETVLHLSAAEVSRKAGMKYYGPYGANEHLKRYLRRGEVQHYCNKKEVGPGRHEGYYISQYVGPTKAELMAEEEAEQNRYS